MGEGNERQRTPGQTEMTGGRRFLSPLPSERQPWSIDGSNLGCLCALYVVFSAREALLMLQALFSMPSSPSPSSVDLQVLSSEKPSPTAPCLFHGLIHSTYHSR